MSKVITYGPFKSGDDLSNLPRYIRDSIKEELKTSTHGSTHSLYFYETENGEYVGIWRPDKEEEPKVVYSPIIPVYATKPFLFSKEKLFFSKESQELFKAMANQGAEDMALNGYSKEVEEAMEKFNKKAEE